MSFLWNKVTPGETMEDGKREEHQSEYAEIIANKEEKENYSALKMFVSNIGFLFR
jgi:hypothetical protein